MSLYMSTLCLLFPLSQAWSIVFPSWLSLVLLLWALIIWLLPLLSPKRALLYTSPLLVLYSCCLLTLQLLPHLNLDKAEQPGDLQEMIKLRFVYQEPNPRLHFPFLILQVCPLHLHLHI